MSARMIDDEAAWEFAAAIDATDACGSSLVLSMLTTASAEARSHDELLDLLDYDPVTLYRYLGCLEDAARTVGIEVPWEPRLEDERIVLHPTDRDALCELETACRNYPHLQYCLHRLLVLDPGSPE